MKKRKTKMIIKSWQFRGYEWSHDLPEWLKTECSKRKGNPYLWVHTQQGEQPATSGQYISINLRGHVAIHDKNPDGWKKEIIAGAALIIIIACVTIAMLSL